MTPEERAEFIFRNSGGDMVPVFKAAVASAIRAAENEMLERAALQVMGMRDLALCDGDRDEADALSDAIDEVRSLKRPEGL